MSSKLKSENDFPTLKSKPASPPSSQHAQRQTRVIQKPDSQAMYSIPTIKLNTINNSRNFGADEAQKICADIGIKYGVTIKLIRSNDTTSFVFNGKRDDVDKAKAEMRDYFNKSDVRRIRIPKEHFSVICGRGGSTRRMLEEKFNCRIMIPNGVNNPLANDEIVVTGSAADIENAASQIKLISDDLKHNVRDSVVVPKKYYPFVVGVDKRNIEQLASEMEISVVFVPSFSSSSNDDDDKIIVKGRQENVNAFKERVMAACRDLDKRCWTIDIDVHKWKHKYLMENKRSVVHDILENTGVSVEVPPKESASDTITLRGPSDGLREALTMLRERVISIDCFEVELPVEICCAADKIRRCRETIIRELKSLGRVDFVDGGDTIRAEAPPPNIDDMRVKLHLMLEHQKKLDDFEIKLTADTFKYVVGKSNWFLNKLKNEYDVKINYREGRDDGNRDSNNNNIVETSSSCDNKTDKKKTKKSKKSTTKVDDRKTTEEKQQPLNVLEYKVIRMSGLREGVEKAKQILLKRVEGLKNQKCISIPHYNRRPFVDENRRLLGELEKTYDVEIVLPESGGNEVENCVFKINGAKNEVDLCHAKLKHIADEFNDRNYREEVSILKHLHKFVVGRSGATINEIKNTTGANIQIPGQDSDSDTVVVTGTKSDVLAAKKCLLRIRDEYVGYVNVEEMTVPVKLLTCEMLMRAIRREFNSVVTTKTDSIEAACKKSGGGGQVKVVVTGPTDSVAKAKEFISGLSNGWFSDQLVAEYKYHPFLFGKGGSKVQKLQKETRALIVFPKETDPERETISIVAATKSAVERAKTELQNSLTEVLNRVEKRIDVDAKYHRDFIRNRAALINKIVEECGGGVSISFPPQGAVNYANSTRVVLRGGEKEVELATAAIKKYVKDVERRTSKLVEIPFRYHESMRKAVTGYPTIGSICRSTNVELEFAPRINVYGPPSRDHVRVFGTPENVEKAIEELLSLVPVTVELKIAHAYHPKLIGPRGATIREILTKCGDEGAKIDIPKPEERLDVVKVAARPAAIEQLTEMIQRKVNELDNVESSTRHRMEIHVDRRYYADIIGPQGSFVGHLRDKYNVNVIVPGRNERSAPVVVVGRRTDVEEAKNEILKMVDAKESLFRKEITLDGESHSRLIGVNGNNVRKLKETFNVDIRFPGKRDPCKNVVTLSGERENVEKCEQELYNQEEELCLSRGKSGPSTVPITEYLLPAEKVKVQSGNDKTTGGLNGEAGVGKGDLKRVQSGNDKTTDKTGGLNGEAGVGSAHLKNVSSDTNESVPIVVGLTNGHSSPTVSNDAVDSPKPQRKSKKKRGGVKHKIAAAAKDLNNNVIVDTDKTS